jgi:hypothetical protein
MLTRSIGIVNAMSIMKNLNQLHAVNAGFDNSPEALNFG